MMPILTVDKLTKKYGNHTVVDRISFTLTAGKCIALIGPNGAGKTTALRMITRLIHPTSGKIQFLKENEKEDDRRYIGYLPQHPVFYNWMTGLQFMKYCAELTNIPKEDALQKSERLLDEVGLSEAKHKKIGTYSGGMKQRLGIAQAIIHDPKLLIMDEPVSALDPIGRREVLTLMEKLKEKMTILFSTHILNDADEISDELILLHHGKIVESGSVDTLRKKYRTDKIKLTFEHDHDVYVKEINSVKHVTNVTKDKDAIYVTVSDITAARADLLQLVSQQNWSLTSFIVHTASLEDMFMKVVNDDAVDDNVS